MKPEYTDLSADEIKSVFKNHPEAIEIYEAGGQPFLRTVDAQAYASSIGVEYKTHKRVAAPPVHPDAKKGK